MPAAEMPPSSRPVDDMLCFSLYAATRATTQLYRRLLAPWGLTYPQYLVLVELWARERMTVSELGDDLMLDSGTLSPLLSRLGALGLVTRERSARDARVVEVSLTERGWALRDELASVRADVRRCIEVTPQAARSLRDDVRAYTAAVEGRSSLDPARDRDDATV